MRGASPSFLPTPRRERKCSYESATSSGPLYCPRIRCAAFVADPDRRGHWARRPLAAAGFGHSALVAETRFATAAAVLEQTDAKILDLALDLGYSDHANFTRAFRRWARCSPRKYRVRHSRLQHESQGRSAGGPEAVDARSTVS